MPATPNAPPASKIGTSIALTAVNALILWQDPSLVTGGYTLSPVNPGTNPTVGQLWPRGGKAEG